MTRSFPSANRASISRLTFVILLMGCQPSHRQEQPTDQYTCSQATTFYDEPQTLHSFGADAAFDDTINDCLYHRDCTFAELPLLGQSHPQVTLDAIAARTVTSHPWMKQRFMALLATAPPELLAMFRHVTAIGIAANVRPSHYWSRHGAILIDPMTLWLTADERQTIPQTEDCRSQNFRKTDLSFRVIAFDFWQGAYIYRHDRDEAYLRVQLFKLLAHELAHAMDYTLSTDQPMSAIDLNQTMADYPWTRPRFLSEQIALSDPDYQEGSNLLPAIAAFFYAGKPAPTALQQLQPEQVGELFAASPQANLYSYTDRYEAFASTIEDHLSRKHLGVASHLGVIASPESPAGCADTPLTWLHQNRDLAAASTRLAADLLTQAQPTLAATSNDHLPLAKAHPSTITAATQDLCLYLGAADH